jgi:large subunit ribosomal protein L21
MFAVVNIAGQQFKVVENEKYFVPRLEAEPNSEVTFDDVLILSDDKSIKIGAPNITGAKVHAKILEHLKDDKVIVFKKKIRISYKRKNGHKQPLTKIEVTKIS